jgi:hypothetical protein
MAAEAIRPTSHTPSQAVGILTRLMLQFWKQERGQQQIHRPRVAGNQGVNAFGIDSVTPAWVEDEVA